MKSLSTLFIVLCLSVAATAQEPLQRSLITKHTATWCVNCGTWGWAFMEGLVEDNSDAAVFLGAHASGDFGNTYSDELTRAFGAAGQPNFFLGQTKLSVNSSNYTDRQIELKETMEAASAQMPIANTWIKEGDTADGKIEMTAQTKFFQAAEGDFYLSILLLEDNIQNFQSGQGDDAIHTNVVRTAATASVFGASIASGAIDADTEVLTPFEIDLDPSWNINQLKLVFILWNKVGEEYEFVNTYSTNALFSVTATHNNALPSSAYNLTTNLSADIAQLIIGNNNMHGEASVQLYDLNGRMVKNIWQGAIHTSTALQISNTDLAAGTYFLKIEIDNKIATEKLVFIQ